MRRLLVLGAIACGIAGLGGPAPAAAAPSSAAAACGGSSGVTVVVDFGSLGGGTQVRCAPGDPSSGLAALSAAGFTYGFVNGQPGLVCVIDRRPDPCNGAPSDAYWAYHHGTRGGSWSFSNEGAGTYDPEPGSVEGWAFGSGRTPSSSPPPPPTTTTRPPAAAPPPPTRPAPTTAAPAPPPPPPSTRGAGAPTTLPAPSTDGGDPTEPGGSQESDDAADERSAAGDDSTTTTGDDGDTDRPADDLTGAAADDETALADASTSTAEDGGGLGAGPIVGVLVVVAVTAGAIRERRRRAPT